MKNGKQSTVRHCETRKGEAIQRKHRLLRRSTPRNDVRAFIFNYQFSTEFTSSAQPIYVFFLDCFTLAGLAMTKLITHN